MTEQTLAPDDLPSVAAEERTASDLQGAVSIVLRVGVVVSSALMAVGTVLTLVLSGSRSRAARSVPSLRRGALHPTDAAVYRSIAAVWRALAHQPGPALVMVGVLLLIATPVLRVAVSVVGYALERDRRFVVVTAVVLAVLLASFAIG
jgi:uncharacterized membrane protein